MTIDTRKTKLSPKNLSLHPKASRENTFYIERTHSRETEDFLSIHPEASVSPPTLALRATPWSSVIAQFHIDPLSFLITLFLSCCRVVPNKLPPPPPPAPHPPPLFSLCLSLSLGGHRDCRKYREPHSKRTHSIENTFYREHILRSVLEVIEIVDITAAGCKRERYASRFWGCCIRLLHPKCGH